MVALPDASWLQSMLSEPQAGQNGRGHQISVWQSLHFGSSSLPWAVASQKILTSGCTNGTGVGVPLGATTSAISGVLLSQNQRAAAHAGAQRSARPVHQRDLAVRHLELGVGGALHLPDRLQNLHHAAHAGVVVA